MSTDVTTTDANIPTARPWRAGRRVGAALALATALVACGSDAADEESVATAVDDIAADVSDAAETAEAEVDDLAATLRDNGLASVASALETVDVDAVFGTDPFTFFAPNDEAFQSLGTSEAADLLTDPALLIDVLRNHTIDQAVTADELAAMDSVETRAGNTLDVTTDAGVRLADASVVQTDIDVGNGIVHVVDELIVP